MDIGNAVSLLKQGFKVRRAGWNGKGMWLMLIHPYAPHPEGPDGKPSEASASYCNPYFKAANNNSQAQGTMADWVGIKTASNLFVPWNASQEDLLASDFEIAMD